MEDRIRRALREGALLASAVVVGGCTNVGGSGTSWPFGVCTQDENMQVLPYEDPKVFGELMRQTREAGGNPARHVVCAPSARGACPTLTRENYDDVFQDMVLRGPSYDSGCSSVIEPLGRTATGEIREGVCGPIADPQDKGRCCYVVPVRAERYCKPLGRPFLVGDEARVARVVETRGWSGDWEAPAVEDEALRAEVAAYWAECGAHEHASVAAFSRQLLELLGLGAPRVLVAETTRAIDDEIEHARACFTIASGYAGQALGPDIVELEGSMGSAGDLEAFVRALILEGCVGETQAALIARVSADAAQDPHIRATLHQNADDEERHALLAWRILGWMVATWPELGPVADATFAAARPVSGHAPLGVSAHDTRLLAHGCASERLEHALQDAAWAAVIAPSLAPQASA